MSRSSDENPPFICLNAMRCAAAVCDAITSATASAWARSILPLRNALWVNSPGSAARAPASWRRSMTEETMYEEAWHDISTEFSPVYECGARNTLTRTSSRTVPLASSILPNLMVYPAASEIDPLRHDMTLSAMLNASGPLTLITEMAPVPGTVAGAHIVSSFLIYIAFLLATAKLP